MLELYKHSHELHELTRIEFVVIRVISGLHFILKHTNSPL